MLANLGELLIIPINMRDGSVIAKGKGKGRLEFFCPYEAGRVLSSGMAK